MPCLSCTKATSSTMKTPGSRIARRSSTTRSGLTSAIAAAIEGPGAAEGAIPRAAARELDRGAGIEHADKILAAVAQQVARRHQIVERLDKAGLRPFAACGDRARNQFDTRPGLDRGEQQRHRRLALALEHAVDRACAMLDQSARGERSAVTADADEDVGQPRLCRFCQVDDLRARWRGSCRKRRRHPAASSSSSRK